MFWGKVIVKVASVGMLLVGVKRSCIWLLVWTVVGLKVRLQLLSRPGVRVTVLVPELTATSVPMVPPKVPVVMAGLGLSTLPTFSKIRPTLRFEMLVKAPLRVIVRSRKVQLKPLVTGEESMVTERQAGPVRVYAAGKVTVTVAALST